MTICHFKEITFAKTFKTVAMDREKNWQIADCCVPNNNPRNNCRTHFDSSFLPFSIVVNTRNDIVLLPIFFVFTNGWIVLPSMFFFKILLTLSLSAFVSKVFKQILPHSGHLMVLIVQESLSARRFVITQALFVLLTSYGCYYTGFD